MINATGHKTLKLWYGGDMEIVAIDGYALDTWPGTPPTENVKSIVIPVAARAEFVVTGPSNGYASFRTLCYDSGVAGDRDPDLKLATMAAPHQKQTYARIEEPLRVGAPLPRNGYTTPLPPPAAHRTIIFQRRCEALLDRWDVFFDERAAALRRPRRAPSKPGISSTSAKRFTISTCIKPTSW